MNTVLIAEWREDKSIIHTCCVFKTEKLDFYCILIRRPTFNQGVMKMSMKSLKPTHVYTTPMSENIKCRNHIHHKIHKAYSKTLFLQVLSLQNICH